MPWMIMELQLFVLVGNPLYAVSVRPLDIASRLYYHRIFWTISRKLKLLHHHISKLTADVYPTILSVYVKQKVSFKQENWNE